MSTHYIIINVSLSIYCFINLLFFLLGLFQPYYNSVYLIGWLKQKGVFYVLNNTKIQSLNFMDNKIAIIKFNATSHDIFSSRRNGLHGAKCAAYKRREPPLAENFEFLTLF